MTTTGLQLRGLSAAIEKRPREFRPVVLDAEGDVVAAGKWEEMRTYSAMYDRADALLRRHIAGAS